MNASIILLTYNKSDLTVACLKSLRANTPTKFIDDVIVIDNKSIDDTLEKLKSFDWIKVIKNEKNLGFAHGCNQGAKKAKNNALIFLNNDTEVQKGWIEPLLVALQDETVGVAGSKLLFPDGTIQHAGIVISKDHIPRHIYYRENDDSKYVNYQRDFQAVTAACFALKGDIFFSINGFDEVYKNGLEDVDLCLRIKEKNLRVVYVPKSVVIHHESMSPGRSKYNDHNLDTYLSRWSNIISDEGEKYREDGFSKLYILHKSMDNYFYEERNGKNNILFGITRFLYIFSQRIWKALKLLIKFDIRSLVGKFRNLY